MKEKLFHTTISDLNQAVQALCSADVEVIAPTDNGEGAVNFQTVTSLDDMAKDYVNTVLPLKELFFPQTEVLLEFEKTPEKGVTIKETSKTDCERVVFGCRPCDAAALSVLDKVFQWDYDDVPYQTKRKQTAIVTWACTKPNENCFCTSVGGCPQGATGSDVLVFPNGDADLLLCAVTEKGEELIARFGDSVSPAAHETTLPESPALEKHFDPKGIKEWLDDNFESDFWTEVSLKCLGCGACSYLCPTCHCFDIVDEGSWNKGERRRNWDCCSYDLFTLHASGHNPRPEQQARCRQRLMHKFKYFQDRFGATSCVGCGRCIRNCGVGQNLVEILCAIETKVGEQH